MLNFLISLQYLSVIVILVEIILIMFHRTSDLQKFLIVVFIATLINAAGYLMEMQAGNEQGLIDALKIIYMGKPFIIVSVFFFCLEFFNMKYPAFLPVLLYTFHGTVSMLVFNCEKNTLFYSSMVFTEEGLYPHLILGHGVFYYLHTASFAVYFIIVFIISVIKYRKLKTVNEKRCTILINVIIMTSAVALGIFFSGITRGYDTTSLSYLLGTLLLLICLLRYDLLTNVAITKEVVIDEIAQGIIAFDQSDNMIYCNKQFTELFGMSEDHVEDSVVSEIRTCYAEDEPMYIGESIYKVSKRDISFKKGTTGYMFVLGDVTESTRHGIELERQKNIAETANRAKSDFLARMSHEIRTPINAVIGMDEMILRRSGDGEVRKYAQDIQSAANSLLGIINDILDTSKIESGKMEIVPVEFRMTDLLTDVYNMILIKVDQKSLGLKFDISPDLPSVLYGDDVRIKQIMINLLSNAVKYTTEGSVTLSINGEKKGNEYLLHCEVRDTGIGIKKEDLSKLFVDFERIEEERNRNIEGTGLGMGICLRLLKLMNSELVVDSIYGVGSVFSFDLQLPVIDEKAIGDIRSYLLKEREQTAFVQKFTASDATILVVDDNDINRKVIRNFLSESLILIEEADNGENALKMVRQKKYDIIFLDHMMPGMDGIEVFHIMKQEALCVDIPVIMLSANAVMGAREMYLDEGFTDYLDKPVHPDKLDDMLIHYLPAEKVCLATEDAVPDKEKDAEPIRKYSPETGLPPIEGFDYEKALEILQTEELLAETLQSFREFLPESKEKLGVLYEAAIGADHPETCSKALSDYRIVIHSVKSSAATVGYTELFERAKSGEAAAKDGNIEAITQMHPGVLQLMDEAFEKLTRIFS